MRAQFVLLLLLFAASSPVDSSADNSADNSIELSDFIKTSGSKTGIIKPAQGLLKHDYLVPAGPYFQLFDWDMYFMSVALSYDKVGAPVASSVEDFLEFVDEDASDSGYAPRIISPDRLWALPEQCKPFMAQAAVRASQTLKSYEWVRPYYDKLKLMTTFWETSRRKPNGLFVWYNGVESGVDNNPAVSDNPALVTEGVDLQIYLIREYQALALLGQKLGDTKSASEFRSSADHLKSLVQKLMWSKSDQLFYDIDSISGKKIRIKSWVSFTPLWARVASPSQAKSMIQKHLLNPKEFWSANGVRTLSATEKLYDPREGYWQGPVWVISNYLLMHGLMNYGYKKEAIDLAQKTITMLVGDFRKSGGMNECYNPESGAPIAGGNFISWNLLAEHMLEEAQSGTDPTSF